MKQTILWLSLIGIAGACRAKSDVAADSDAARIASPDTVKADTTQRDSTRHDTVARGVVRADLPARHSAATMKPSKNSDTTRKGSVTQTDSGFTRIKLPDGRTFKVRNPGAEPSVPKDSFPKKP